MGYAQGDFVSINPSTEEVLGTYPCCKEDVSRAVGAAKEAFNSWRKVSRVKRAEYFDKLCEVLKDRKDRIVRAICAETGKSINESVAEFNEALHMVQFTFGMGRMPSGSIIPSEIAEKDSFIIRKPKGRNGCQKIYGNID